MKPLREYVHDRSIRTSALVYFLLAGALSQAPLFNYLGYEFSAAMTIPAALISGIVTIGFVRDDIHMPLSRRAFMPRLGGYFVVHLLLLLIPLVVISANAFVVKNCSFPGGLAYFALLPVCTVLFSVSLGALLAVLFRRARIVFVGLVLLILCQILFITYTEPQLFAYNFILGYFPGITYDETLNGFSTLVAYREFTLVAALLFLILFFLCVRMVWPDYKVYENVQAFRLRRGDAALYVGAFLCIAVLLFGHFFGNVFGFQYSAGDIQEELGGMATTAHFTIFYPREALQGRDLEILKGEAEFHYAVDADRLKEGLRPGEKISVYLYPDAETKRQFIGTSTTNIAKPWRREIHLTLDSFDETFRHEVVHVLARGIGLPIVGASDRMALNEGCAEAIDWQWGRFSPHEYAAALLRDSMLGSPEALFGYTGFATQQGSYAYIVAGSFVRYLIDRYGIASFKEVFPSGQFFAVYGAPLRTLLDDWKGFLRTVDVSSLPPETVRAIFGQQSIFRKTCARVTAERNARGVRAMRVKNYAEAEGEFAASFEDVRTPFALRGLLQSLLNEGKFAEGIALYEQIDGHSLLRLDPGARFLYGDALWLHGDPAQALKIFREIEGMNYSEGYSEGASLRCEIVKEPRLDAALGVYFYGSMRDSAKLALLRELRSYPDSKDAAMYLVAGRLLAKKEYDEAGKAYQEVSTSFGDPVLHYARSMNGGEAFYHAAEFERAKGMFWEAQNFAASSTRVRKIQEWIDRCDFVSAAMD